MARAFGYISNDFSLVRSGFRRVTPLFHGEDLSKRSAWGIGYAQNDQLLLKKRTRAATSAIDLEMIVADLRSQCIVGWMGPTSDAGSAEDVPPFRHRSWLMCPTAEIGDSNGYAEALRAQLPDYVASGIRGSHPAELLLHYAVEHLRLASSGRRLTRSPRSGAVALALAMRGVTLAAQEARTEVPPVQNYILTDGHILYASRNGAPLFYNTIEGISDDPVLRSEPLFAGHRPRRVDHPTFRAVFVASEGPVADGWKALEDSSVLWVDTQHDVHIESLGSLSS